MPRNETIECIHCQSDQVIKHGKNRAGEPRYRCKECKKTWVKGVEATVRPDISSIAESFLLGYSIRDLAPFYKTSPHRLNLKIRKFFEETGHWEDFLDERSEVRATNIMYLQGVKFNCTYNSPENNQMYLALAIDGLSSTVIGYEIAEKNNKETWDRLIGRIKKRNYKVNTFICKDIRIVENAVNKYYSDSSIKIYLHKLKREKEVANSCCLVDSKSLREKLIDDALKFYNKLDNQTLDSYINSIHNTDIKSCIAFDDKSFFNCMTKNCGEHSDARLEQLLDDFKDRFEKFHALKTDPQPIINAWIGLQMLRPLDCGFTRYSLYNQIPCKCSFDCFACQYLEEKCEFIPNMEQLNKFANEITIRALQLPMEVKPEPKFKLKIDLLNY